MSRHESDREDLLREATALVERAELTIQGSDEPIVVGFRAGGAASFFFGADPVYQFNSGGELRRAFIAGELYKAERGGLVVLRRERSAVEAALVRSELGADQSRDLLAEAKRRLRSMRNALEAGTFTLVGQSPAQADVLPRVLRWLTEMPEDLQVANRPNVR